MRALLPFTLSLAALGCSLDLEAPQTSTAVRRAPVEQGDAGPADAACPEGATAADADGLWRDTCFFGPPATQRVARDAIGRVGRIIEDFMALQEARTGGGDAYHPLLLTRARQTYADGASVFPSLTNGARGGPAFLGLLDFVRTSLGDKRTGLRVLRICDVFAVDAGGPGGTTWVFTNVATQGGLRPILATETMTSKDGVLARHDFAEPPADTVLDPAMLDDLAPETLTTVCRHHPSAKAAVARYGAAAQR